MGEAIDFDPFGLKMGTQEEIEVEEMSKIGSN